jgi:hypothetical protein
MALFGSGGMSDLSPLCAEDRTFAEAVCGCRAMGYQIAIGRAALLFRRWGPTVHY